MTWSHTSTQRGLFNRGLEPWDHTEEYSSILEASMAYTASMGMMLYKQNKFLRERGELIDLDSFLLVADWLIVGDHVDGHGEGEGSAGG